MRGECSARKAGQRPENLGDCLYLYFGKFLATARCFFVSFLGFLSENISGIYGEFDEEYGTNSYNKHHVDMGVLFNVVSFVTKDFNVYKKSDADYPTKFDVENILFDNRDKSSQEIKYTAPKTTTGHTGHNSSCRQR